MHDPCPHCGSLEAPVIGRCSDCGRLSGRRQQVHGYSGAVSTPPQVILWFRIYWGFHALAVLGFGGLNLYNLIAGGNSYVSDGLGDPYESGAENTRVGLVIIMSIMTAFGIPMLLAVFLPRRPWAWTYGIVMLWFGVVTSVMGCCLMVAATIPLIIYWSKPRCKAWFKNPPPSELEVEDVFA